MPIFLTNDTQVQKQVLDGLQKGNDALEKANAVFSLDEIESIMSDTEDAVEKQREIERMLSGGLTEVRKAMIIFLFVTRSIVMDTEFVFTRSNHLYDLLVSCEPAPPILVTLLYCCHVSVYPIWPKLDLQ